MKMKTRWAVAVMILGILVAVVVLLLAGGCTATDALMNRDRLQQLQDASQNQRDVDLATTTPPSVTQTGAVGGEGAPQVIAVGDEVVKELAATLKYLKSTQEERQTQLTLKDLRKLNLLGYALAGVIIVALFVYVWRRTATARAAISAATKPAIDRIKALMAAKIDETDPERIARMNAEIASLNSLKADIEKKLVKA